MAFFIILALLSLANPVFSTNNFALIGHLDSSCMDDPGWITVLNPYYSGSSFRTTNTDADLSYCISDTAGGISWGWECSVSSSSMSWKEIYHYGSTTCDADSPFPSDIVRSYTSTCASIGNSLLSATSVSLRCSVTIPSSYAAVALWLDADDCGKNDITELVKLTYYNLGVCGPSGSTGSVKAVRSGDGLSVSTYTDRTCTSLLGDAKTIPETGSCASGWEEYLGDGEFFSSELGGSGTQTFAGIVVVIVVLFGFHL